MAGGSPSFTSHPHVAAAAPGDWPPDLLRRMAETVGDLGPWGWQPPYALFDDDPGFRPGGFGRGVSGTVADRHAGRNLPLYWSEVDLRGFRVLSRWLWDTNPFMIGFGRRLTDYHVRKGFQWQACLAGQRKQPYATAAAQGESADGRLATRAQNILDAWRDRYAWPLRSREGFLRLHRDGEFASRFGWERRGDLPWVRWVEPEQIGSPVGDTDSANSFGVRTAPGDAETVTGYYVRDADGDGTRGDWVAAGKLVFAKANVDAKVKRGLPDSFSVHEYLDESKKLVRNMLVVAAAQAAIAWREKFPLATAAQVQALIPTTAVNLQVPPWLNGGQTVYSQQLAAGTVLRTEGSREFEAGPVSTGVASYVEAEQAALRACCVRWGFPPYMTAKADDVNFASSLTAGSPFALAVEGGQVEWGAVEKAVAVKVLDLACESGLLTPEERKRLDVEVVAPSVITPDPAADTQRRKVLYDARVLDPYTWMQEEGYDPSHVEANWQAWRERNPRPDPVAPPAVPSVVVGEDRAGLVRTTVTDRNGVTRHVWTRPEDADHVAGAGDGPPSLPPAGSLVGRAVGRLKAVGSAALDTRVGRFLVRAEHTLALIAHKTREVAAGAAARRRPPLDADGIARLTRVLAVADFVGSFVAGGVVAATIHPLAGKVTSTSLPTVSVLYVAYAAVRDPAGTWAAARQVVADTLRGRAAAHEAAEPAALADKLAALFAGPDADWREALYLAALAATDDPDRAADVAARAGETPADLPTPTPADFGEEGRP